MNILGVKITSHDTGATLISNGKIVAIAEERLNRVKHSKNMFPTLSIAYCLDVFGLEPKDVNLVVIDTIGYDKDTRAISTFNEKTGRAFKNAKIHCVNHHDAHAAAAFFCSPFKDAAVMVIDGAGENKLTHLGMIGTETETLYHGTDATLTEIQKTLHVRRRSAFRFSMGIGKLYTLISEGYLNFGQYNEGKLMGLAPYGSADVLKLFPFARWFREYQGHLLCNPLVTFPGFEAFRAKKKIDSPFKSRLKELVEKIGVSIVNLSTEGRKEFFSAPNLFEPIVLTQPRRDAKAPLPEKWYADVAYAIQKVLEEVVVTLGKRVRRITQSRNLCVSGGVGLNIDANTRLLEEAGFDHIFVQPAATDSGIALGCALYGAHVIAKLPRFWEMKSASLGRIYTDAEILSAIQKRSTEITFKKSKDISTETAKLIASGTIVGWFQGGSEYGPRALGNRSILVDARRTDMKDIVNKRVKHREMWRPFAASVLAEKQREWFELDEPSPFMLLAAQVPKDKQKLIPSVVHVDGTCRIQAVTPEGNQAYYNLLKAFENETGVPLVLNTSFNDAGEPIVETPSDALSCFLNTDMDYLILHDYIITKKSK